MQPLIELGRQGAVGYRHAELVVPRRNIIPEEYLRTTPLNLPELTEHDVTREMMERSHHVLSVDEAKLFPLGSCTMIYTPHAARRVEDFANSHLYQPDSSVQGNLRILYDLENILSELGGAKKGTLQPIAGAHGELTAMFMIGAYHKFRNDKRRYALIPQSAHGTNPSSAAMAGLEVRNLPPEENGKLDLGVLKDYLSQTDRETGRELGYSVAAFMITQPSTYGLYEEKIIEITGLMHKYGIQVYCDGANFAALNNRVKLIDLGADAFHFNLHKTFGVYHGGGGPGAGFVGVAEHLESFLPVPLIKKRQDKFVRSYNAPLSIGPVSGTLGNFLADIIAYQYIHLMGSDGMREATGIAVLNGNYQHHLLSKFLPPAFAEYVMHEGIVTDAELRKLKVKIQLDGKPDEKDRPLTVADLAKAIIDSGRYYAPTVSFPLHEGILTEPTSSARRQDMDDFAADLEQIVIRASEDPEWLATSPHNLIVGRGQQALANRNPVFKWVL